MNNRRNSIIAVVIALVVTASLLSFSPEVRTTISKAALSARDYVLYNNSVSVAIRDNLFTQLLGTGGMSGRELESKSVIDLTNKERQKESQDLAVLVENKELDAAAEMKLKDLFARQYFEHTSPDGHGPSWLAEQAGYSYVVVGENLALGNFNDESALIAAWMASPGHRANILNKSYIDIGVAVGQGIYEGKKVWIAVQEFGKPLSDCPAISTALSSKIESLRATVDGLSADLAKKKQVLATMSQSSAADQAAYNQKATEFNREVAVYNSNSAELRVSIDTYNTQVKAFNACIKQ
jgi:uncharacterized protein YkwD